jgi:DnaJ-domain-containing protein 1
MTKSLVVCPSCEREVPEGKFCNICGAELPEMAPPEVPDEVSQDEVTSVEEYPVLESSSMPHFDMTIEDVPHEAAVILLARAELEVIDQELDRIINQTKATRQALTLQQADRDVLVERAEKLRVDFDEAKSRKQELLAVKHNLRLEHILKELDKQELRFEKLEAIEGSVDKDVYKEQRIEITQQIKTLRDALKDAIKESKKWTKGIKKTLKTLGKETSRVDAKFKIGDISRDAYDIQSYNLKRSIKIVEGVQRRLDALLSRAEKK